MARRPRSTEDDEPAPWLEPRARASAPAAEEPRQTVVSWRALIIGAVIALVLAVGLVIGARTMIARDEGTGVGEEAGLIRAPAEPYKTRPDNPNAPALEGEGQTIYDTADGADPQGQLDVNALPEEPQRPLPRDLLPEDPAAAEAGDAALIDGPAAPSEPTQPAAPRPLSPPTADRVPAPGPRPSEAKAAPAPPAPARAPRDIVEAALTPKPKPDPKPSAAAPSGGSGSVQLGAFSTEARAEAVRDRLATRFPELSALRVTLIERDGQTLFRLRGTAADTAAACAKLKLAGESCIAAQ